MTRRPILALALTCAALAAACDSGPKGPGTLTATVIAPQELGAVVLEFTGGTVVGFEAQGDTQVYSSAIGGAEPSYRVILVSPTGAQLHFGIKVSDRGSARPSVAAISAASTTNAPVVPSGLQIKIEG